MSAAPTLDLAPHAVLAGLGAAHRALDDASSTPLWSMDVDEMGDALAELTRLEARAAALRLQVLAAAEAADAASLTGQTGTGAWARRHTGQTVRAATGNVWLARLLEEKYAATGHALSAGRIHEDHAWVIVRAGERVPDEVTADQLARAEEGLIAKAAGSPVRQGMDAKALRRAARRMLEVISPALADRHEAAELTEEERKAQLETWFYLWDNDNGTSSGKFTIPTLQAAFLRGMLEKLSAPRRLGRGPRGTVVDESAEQLSYHEALGVAFCEVLEHLPTKGHEPVGATLVVHLDHGHLLQQVGSARLDTGEVISPGEARRIACGAGIIPQVLGGPSVVLDQGRMARLHTGAQRFALSTRHETCAAQGCERPFAWCEIHHPHAWSAGGVTSLDNGLPLCGWHHRRAHDDRFEPTYHPDRSVSYRRRRPGRP